MLLFVLNYAQNLTDTHAAYTYQRAESWRGTQRRRKMDKNERRRDYEHLEFQHTTMLHEAPVQLPAYTIQPLICSVLHPLNSGVASYGSLVYVPPRLPTISFLVHFGVNLTANYPSIV